MSKQSASLLTLTMAATSNFGPSRFMGPNRSLAVAAGNTLGVVKVDAVPGDPVPVDVMGTSTVIAQGSFNEGDALEVGSAGRATIKASGVTVARALEAAQEGHEVEVLLIQN